MIVRDLLVGTTRFSDLARGLPGLSRSLLTKRLRRLESAGLVERLDGEYLLTEAGRELEPIVFGFGSWGARWMFGHPHEDELDAELLLWWCHTRLNVELLPDRRVVLRFGFSDDARPFWIVVESTGPSVCLTDPGYEVDVLISTDLCTLYEVWLGRAELVDAVRAGTVAFEGPSALTRRMPHVLQLSPIAPLVASTPPAVAVD